MAYIGSGKRVSALMSGGGGPDCDRLGRRFGACTSSIRVTIEIAPDWLVLHEKSGGRISSHKADENIVKNESGLSQLAHVLGDIGHIFAIFP